MSSWNCGIISVSYARDGGFEAIGYSFIYIVSSYFLRTYIFINHRRFFITQSILDLMVSTVFMFQSMFNKYHDQMDNGGILGFLECVLWHRGFFFWTFSVSSTYNIVAMTVER